MNVLKCLYLEDVNADYDTFSQIISRAMKNVATVEFERAYKADEGLKLLQKNPLPYQIVFIDLMMEDGSLGGQEVVEEAIKLNVVPIVISNEIQSDPKISRTLQNQRVVFLEKSILRNKFAMPSGELCKIILDKMNEHDISPIPLTTAEFVWRIGQNIRLDAEIEAISKEVLVGLLQKIEQDSTRLFPHFLTPATPVRAS